MNSNSIHSNIYKLYLLCLPFDRLFEFPFGDFFDKIITQFSTLVMLIGSFALLMGNRKIVNGRNNLFFKLYAYMALSSVVMAGVLSLSLEVQYESPFSSILGDIVLYFFVVLSICYNSYCLSHFIDFSGIYKIFDMQIVVSLFVGYAQLLGMLGFSAPYNVLSSIFALRELSWLTDLDRGVTFFGSEPSSAALFCFVVIPYIYSSIQYGKGFKRFLYLLSLILFAVLVLSSNSSQLLILFIGSAALFVWSCFRPIKKVFYYLSFAVGFFFAVAYLSTETISTTQSSDSSSLEYAILGKIVDRTNMSTAMRASSVINDLKVFAEFPITGVGDGNQGFFYAENQPLWTLSSGEVSDLIKMHAIPNGGGNFFPAYISAYGVIGIVILIFFISRYRALYRTAFLRKNKRIDTIFQIAIILFLFSSWHVVGIKQSETIIFVLSLPCVKYMLAEGR